MSVLLVNSPNHMCNVGVVIFFLQSLLPVTVIRAGVRNRCTQGQSWPFPRSFAILCRETESQSLSEAKLKVCIWKLPAACFLRKEAGQGRAMTQGGAVVVQSLSVVPETFCTLALSTLVAWTITLPFLPRLVQPVYWTCKTHQEIIKAGFILSPCALLKCFQCGKSREFFDIEEVLKISWSHWVTNSKIRVSGLM